MDTELYDFFKDALTKATSASTGTELDAALAEMGWTDALSDAPEVAVSLLFELQGTSNATSSAIEDVLCGALGVARGDAAVVLPAFGGYAVPGVISGGTLTVIGFGTAAMRTASTLLVPALDGDRLVVATVDAASLQRDEVSGIDPAYGAVVVRGSATPTSLVPAEANWESAVHAAQVAVAYELIGASRQMLALAREHALSRVQGGRVIAKFQAVRHRLAETIIAIEGAAAAADAYWINSDDVMAAPIAKAVAGQAARTTARHAQQVLAGMGFTAEHAFHHYFKRTRLLDQLLGSAQVLTRELGERVIATGELPTFLPL
jgi:hypothetical protein